MTINCIKDTHARPKLAKHMESVKKNCKGKGGLEKGEVKWGVVLYVKARLEQSKIKLSKITSKVVVI